ncbi:hypothetical protein HLB44_11735 [Aquincola sp. S2]|uniref:Uncharacterized protein n=1 Tax=Pseudaquabacterium terrae TaxID=2732868 RepID=A0ABX2EGC7_9BURK|nr:hypothetical protein [Aquabacterium terrae]NRF67656.1 hypothetical protein [Aquabacterium terrae]
MKSATSATTPAAASRKPLSAAFTALILVAASSIQAAPALSGPSTSRVAQATPFTGSGFAPNSALSVAVIAPGAPEAHYSTVADAQGTVRYTLYPAVPGAHTLRVLNSAGKVLISVNVHATP